MATQDNPPFNLLRCAVRNASQCLHMLVSDDRQPVTLSLSKSVRDRPASRRLARHEMSDSRTPTRFAKVILPAARSEKAARRTWSTPGRLTRPAAAGIGDTGCLVRTQLEERTTLCGAAVEHGDIVSGLHEVCRHRRAHVAQSNESGLHVVSSVGRSSGSLRGSMLTARVFLPGYEPLSPCYT